MAGIAHKPRETYGNTLNSVDFIRIFTAQFVIDLSQGCIGAGWHRLPAQLFTKLSTYSVGDRRAEQDSPANTTRREKSTMRGP